MVGIPKMIEVYSTHSQDHVLMKLKFAIGHVVVVLSSINGVNGGTLHSEPDDGANHLTSSQCHQYGADRRTSRISPPQSRHPDENSNGRQRQNSGERDDRQTQRQIHHRDVLNTVALISTSLS